LNKARVLGEQGVSVVLGAILILGIIIGAISIIYPMYVRNAIRDKESEHSRVVGEKFAELKSRIEDMDIGDSKTVIVPTSRGQATLVPSSGTLGSVSVYPSAFTIYGGWRQTKWSQSTSPELQSGPWDNSYENFYYSENMDLGENITLQAGNTGGSLTSSICDAGTEIRWGVVNWSDYIPVTIENYWVQDEPPLLIDGNPRIGENLGSYLKTWAQDNDYENIREADENTQAKFLYVENYENYKGRVENFPRMQENNSATYATLIERAHFGTYAQENRPSNGTFTGSAANWTYTEVDPKGFASGSYDSSDGNPSPGSGPGSYGFRYQDTDGAYQIHYFRSDYRTVNTVTARWLRDTLTGAPPGVLDRPLIPPGQKIILDEWTTDQLGITKLLAGLWTFKYWGFRTSADNSGSADLLVDIFRRTSGGTLMGIAENVAAAPLTIDLSEVTGTYDMAEQMMNMTDAIVIRVYARNTSSIPQTVYFYFSYPDWPSRMITTISVPQIDIMRISQTFTAPLGIYVDNIKTKFAFKSSMIDNIDNAPYRVRFLIRNSADTSDVRVMYDSGWVRNTRDWTTYENTIPLMPMVLIPGTSYIIRVEVQDNNQVKWERPRVWVNVDDISLTFTIQRYDMDIGFNIKDVSTGNNYLEMRYRCDNSNDQFRVWVYDFSTSTWNPRGENLNRTSWTFWNYRLGENEAQAGQVRLRIVDRDNMAKLATNLMIDFIRVRSGGVGYRLNWGHLFTGVPVTGSYQIKIYGWANSGENVGVYVWKPSSGWSFIENLPSSPGWVVQTINIADYVVGNDLWIKYGDTVADVIQNEIYIDYCVLEGEKPLDVKITVEVRTGSDNNPEDGGWGSWENIPKGGPIVGPYIRFLQYRVTMWTANPAWKPFLYDISIGVEEMGSIKFEVKNLVYPDQAWIFEGGGVILSQYDLNAMRSQPPLITIRDVAGDKIEVIVNTVTIENFPVSYTSSVPVTVTVTVKDIYYAVQDENCERVIVQVGSSYPNAWTSYFSKLEEIYDERGYNATFVENTLSLTIEGKNLTPGVNDIIYSKKVKVIEVSFG